MIQCKHCGSSSSVKNGIVHGKQRYQCKNCSRTFREGDLREKYSNAQRLRVIQWYLEGAGIMSIERMEGVPNPLIIQWLRKFAKIIRQQLNETTIPSDIRNIEILEVEELFSYCQKKPEKSMYGWLLTETGIKLLKLR